MVCQYSGIVTILSSPPIIPFLLIRMIRVIRGSLFLLSGYGLHLGQEIAEFTIVDLHAVIQVEADPQVSVMPQLFVKGLKFGLLLGEFVPLLLQLSLVRSSSGGLYIAIKLINPGGDFSLQGDHVFRAHPGKGAFIVTVKVDETLEGPQLSTGKEPVNRPFLVHRQMMLKEPGSQIAP